MLFIILGLENLFNNKGLLVVINKQAYGERSMNGQNVIRQL